MKLKLNSLKGLLSIPCTLSIKLTVAAFFMCFATASYSQTSEEEVKKQAETYFEDEDYTKAYKLYAQLVSTHPTDPLYNYRLGVCMIYSEPDKKKSFSYLNKAYQNRQDLPKDVTFFMGKAYHINYLFDEAIRFYNEFKKEAPNSMQKKLQVEREIMACGNGKRLLSALTDLEIVTKKQLNETDYFRSYDLSSIGGKLLIKPEDFKTSYDKKKKDKSIVYLPKTGEKVFFSSYGKENTNGKDIYFRERLPNGQFSEPRIIDGINTEFDEDYPFLHPNGKTLYFASKGHNSMGGYDIFMSTFNESTQSWSTPKNLEFPINSPDDDYLYVTDSAEKVAYFSTGRYSPPGKIDVLKIKTERKPIDIIVMKGTVAKETAKQSVKSKITVKNITTGEIVGTWEAQDNGNFSLELPNGAKLLYTVETPGLRTQSQGINLPMATVGKPFKQTITYDNEVLKIVNNFEEAPSDESYLQYLKLIEEKAKLNPNEGKNKLSPTVVSDDTQPVADTKGNETKNVTAANTNNPSVNPDKSNETKTNAVKNTNTSGINNKQLLDIAKQDAFELEKESKSLNQDSRDAKELGESKKIEAYSKLKEAENELAKAQEITDEQQKTAETKKAIDKKTEAENDLTVANKLIALSEKLDNDAKNKQKEAELNKQYAQELEKASTAKSITPETQQKLDDLQKQIAAVSDQKNESENAYNELKNEIAEKEKDLDVAKAKTESTRKEYDELKNDISAAETELSNTRKKKEKAEINNRITELKAEQTKLENTIAVNEQNEQKISNELNALKNELALTDKVKTETIAKVEEPASIPSNTTTASAIAQSNKTASEQLEEKYSGKINITDPDNKDNIAEVNKQLTAYNKDIDAQIAKNKKDLAKATKPEQKKSLGAEIKSLEATKKQNQQSIANNTNRIADINKQLASGGVANANQNLKEINTDNPSKALTQLEDLKKSLTQADNQLFNYNSYSNSSVQTMKVQADSQINDAFALQNKLKETIARSEETIKNSSVNLTKNSDDPENLLKQSDDLLAKAQSLRTESLAKEGEEKTKLVSEAVKLENEAEAKQIEASELSGKIANEKSEVNKENAQALFTANKSDEQTANQAKTLMEEADQALKQARAIREEANAMGNNAAKIGNLGNAEEKEQIAMNKQNEALTLLKKADNTTPLKPYKEKGTVNIANDAVVKEEINKINEEVKQLVTAKTNAFETLSAANNEELKEQTNNLQNNTTIANTPALKSQLTVINKNMTEISALKAKVDQSTNATEKLVAMNNLVKKQNETLVAVNKLNTDAQSKALAANTPTKTTNEQPTDTKVNTDTKEPKDNNSKNANNASDVAKNNAQDSKQPEDSKEPVVEPKNNVTKEQANTAFTVDLSYENHKDTSINQVNTYFTNNAIELRNEQANSMKNNALDALKALENENNQLNEAIANSKNNSQDPANTDNVSGDQIKTKIDDLLSAADNLSQEASNLKTEAETKSGNEKESLLEQSKNLEDKAFAKKVEAATLTQQYNEANYNANSNAINDMLAKISGNDPEKANSIKEKVSELENKKKQAKNMRDEANALSNNSARFGAIGNAEEQEAEILIKQNEIINELKTQVPDYVVKAPTFSNLNKASEIPAELKQKQSDIAAKQASQLTNLTNAFSLEYETNKNNIPKNLNAEQTKIKNNVFGLNAESKDLLIRSTKTSNEQEKLKLLSLAAKTGHAAATQLNVLINKQSMEGLAAVNNNVKITAPENNNTSKTNDVAVNNTKTNKTNNTNKTNTNKTNTKTTDTKGNTDVAAVKENKTNVKENTSTAKETTNTKENATAKANTDAAAGTKVLARVEGLEVLNKNAYSEAKPIPVDAKMPDGLIFRVQIGAFKTKIANNSFKGLTPVNGETTPSGYIRYTAGNFNKIENASAVKSDLNSNGYPDAFVVAFFNGKRITINEALEILKNEGKTVDLNSAPQTAGIKENVNPNDGATVKVNNDPVVVTKELEKTKNLLFTVQIGVYSRQISKARLSNLSPIYTEQLPNGLYRYTAGIYSNAERLISDKNRVIDLGIKDAFVSAYLEGKRLPFNEAKAKKEADAAIVFEPENPIVFPAVGTVNTATTVPQSIPAPTIAPFTNGVKEKPAATPENGIKENEEGITFKVQIGAYSRQVPDEVANKFNAIKSWPIENKVINGLYIYNIGNFNEAKFAKQLKDEAVAIGITDAFIVVYKDGKKLFGAEATQYLNR